ncbi:MAG: redox-regulated ATPase YchF [Candidatus Latescibacteria bacterium]|nr:redox-regulated ATPase YchF [Candidatus Latescibacterota bacterium]
MKLALIGLPQVGKRTLFRLLVGQEPNPAGGETLGLARVRDARFERLVNMYRPKKVTPAQISFVLLPDLGQQAERNAAIFKSLEQVDAVCHLVRVFPDETVFHVEGSVDSRRDIMAFHEELQFSDMLFAEKRLERLDKERGKKVDAQKAALEADLLTRMKEHLEAGRPLRNFAFTDVEEKVIVSYPLLTRKPVIQVLNVGEDQLHDAGLVDRLAAEFADQAFQWIAVSAKIEEEISQLSPEEREAFLKALQVDQPAMDRLTLLCYSTLGLISFFTVGPDEVRAWTIRRGALAPQAARAIHEDLERGFIRAEVMRYPDLMELGSEQKLKEAGRFMQKGKDYVVEDGDIVNILFKV